MIIRPPQSSIPPPKRANHDSPLHACHSRLDRESRSFPAANYVEIRTCAPHTRMSFQRKLESRLLLTAKYANHAKKSSHAKPPSTPRRPLPQQVFTFAFSASLRDKAHAFHCPLSESAKICAICGQHNSFSFNDLQPSNRLLTTDHRQLSCLFHPHSPGDNRLLKREHGGERRMYAPIQEVCWQISQVFYANRKS